MRPNKMTENNQPNQDAFEEKVIQVSRVSKKTKGGDTMGFSVVMVVGDKQGKVGVAKGKAPDVVSAIRKGVRKAKKHMIDVPIDGTTVPFKMHVRQGAAELIIKPAPKGTGVIAGGPVRAVVEAAGIRDISSKILGTNNQASNAYATFEALQKIANLVKIKGLKLRSLAEAEAEEEKKVQEQQDKAKEAAQESKESKQEAQPEKKPAKKATKNAAKKAVKKAEKKTAKKATKKKN